MTRISFRCLLMLIILGVVMLLLGLATFGSCYWTDGWGHGAAETCVFKGRTAERALDKRFGIEVELSQIRTLI